MRIDSCGKTVYYRPFVILYGCDSVVLGEEKSFEMWAPDFTVGADPNPASSGEQVTLTAVATMTIGTWTDNYSFIQSGYGSLHENFCPGANLPALPDATSTKPLETWVNFLNTIDEVCSAVSNIIQSAIGMAPGEVSHEYRWSTESGEFSTSAADGAVTVYPTATTT